MGMDYAKPIPIGQNLVPHFESPPAASSLGAVHRENATVSSVTALTDNTTVIEVTAITAGAAIRWATNQAVSVITIAGTANFDNIIPAGTVRRFVVPRRIQAPAPSAVGIAVREGLFQAVATKTTGPVGSVLLAEY